MFSLFLSTILAAAPIPKADEGQIAFILKGTKSELILFSPSGKELKRIGLNVLDGRPTYLKLDANHEFAIVSTVATEAVQIGKTYYGSYSGYMLPLDGESKPDLLVENRIHFNWVLNRKEKYLIASEIDVEKMANLKPGKIAMKMSKFDLKTKKQEAITFPSHHLVDFSTDGSTLLSYTNNDGKNRIAITPPSTWKPAFLSEVSDIPFGISPDGKKLFLVNNDTPFVNGMSKPQMSIYDVKTKERRIIDTPKECNGTFAYCFGPDGKHVAFLGYVEEQVPKGISYAYKLYTCKIDGSQLKLLF